MRVVETREDGDVVYRKRKCDTGEHCPRKITKETTAPGNAWPAGLREKMLERLAEFKGRRERV